MINPTTIKLAAGASILASILGFGIYIGKGIEKSNTGKIKDQLHANQLMHLSQMQSIKDAERLRIDERQAQINHLQREFAIADQNYSETIKNAKIETDRLAACVKSGDCVQRVKIKSPVCRAENNGKADDQKGVDGSTYAELDPETAVGAYGVTNDGDQAIMDLNELQKRVNDIAKICPIEFI